MNVSGGEWVAQEQPVATHILPGKSFTVISILLAGARYGSHGSPLQYIYAIIGR